MNKYSAKEFQRVLIVRTDRIGDVVLSTPVIANLRKNFPSSYLAFMCSPYTYELVYKNPYLDEAIVFDKKKNSGFWGTFRFARFLRRKNFTLALILSPKTRIHLLAYLAGIPRRVGWEKKGKIFLTEKIPYVKKEGRKHELEYNLDLLRRLGVKIVTDKTFIGLGSEEQKWAENFFNQNNLEGKLTIALHPGASCISKRWPQDYFIRLAGMLKGRLGAKIILVSSAQEKELFGGLAQEADFDLRGRLSLLKLAALLKKVDLFISNDSGPVHIAANFNTPVISIFGRKEAGLSPARWRPRGKNSYYIRKDAGCKVCLAHNCQIGFKCLKAITPEEVFQPAKKVLKTKRA